ncbi:hypothetical protein CAEBREN_07198 [Caenorhabditis brenneri]|uniref:CCHC-type domain-containing protein n=1 Tax=Caenorhabditis brenneri TaxID=135651 RepID=G0P0H1_CAEBE|nr:hypothetical protein CAEBREN_07198 [Caenorhabditis brenneri]
MSTPSKGNKVSDDVVETPQVGALEEVRTSTPVPTEDDELVPKDADGNIYPEESAGGTPTGTPRKDNDIVEEQKEEPPSEDEEKEGSDVESCGEEQREDSPSPNPTLPEQDVFTASSGPLTPQMIAGAPDQGKLHLASSLIKMSEPLRKLLKSRTRDLKTANSTPSRMPNQDELKALHRELSLALANNQEEMDMRQLVLGTQSQIAQINGSFVGFHDALERLLKQSTVTHGHNILQEDAIKAGLAKLEQDVRSSWMSQAKNRAAIEGNGKAIKELAKEISDIINMLREILARVPNFFPLGNPKELTNWIPSSHGTPGTSPMDPALTRKQWEQLLLEYKEPSNWITNGQGTPGPTPTGQAPTVCNKQSGQRQANREPTKKPNAPKKALECPFCCGSHRSYKCEVFTTWQARRHFLLTERGCLKCLKLAINKNDHVCDREKASCFLCHKLGHHSSVCENNPQDNNELQPPAKKPKYASNKDTAKRK